MRIDQSAKIPATMFLRAMDPRFGTDAAIIREFYSTKIVKPSALKADTLKSQNDVLELARRLELGATNAYLGVIPSFKDAQLAKVAARLAADETLHWTVLNQTLGKPLPAGGMPFGA